MRAPPRRTSGSRRTGIEHWTHFYTDYGVCLQKRFFDHFLKGEKNGWDRQPRVQLQVRHVDRFVERHENEWPIARTQWTQILSRPRRPRARARTGRRRRARSPTTALGDGVTFLSAPLEKETEITGPLAAKLFVSSSTSDADLFLVFRVFTARPAGGHLHGRDRPAHAGRPGLAARLAPQARSKAVDRLPALSYARRSTAAEAGRDRRARCRDLADLASSCRPGYRIALTVRGKDYEWRRRPARSSPTSRTSSPAAARSCTTIPATGPRRSSAGRSPSTRVPGTRRIYCCPSFRNRERRKAIRIKALLADFPHPTHHRSDDRRSKP